MTDHPPELAELYAALQPLVDASLRYPKLKSHLPRLDAALQALAGVWPSGDVEVATRSGNGVEAPATVAALNDVARGEPVARAARNHGVQSSTLFRALKRRRAAAPGATEGATFCPSDP